ncbi:MAG TPA: VWA domain-containing protein [Blastocatellia bacterium]|jgi:Ca-activated chloride channel family protein|nr:VWA domain-containing protein [Blastocatellia bacterium]
MKPSDVLKLMFVVVLMSLVLGPLSLAQQHENKREHQDQQEGAIKLATDLVALNVMVTDQNGRAASGLKKEDFKVYENGIEQPISFFSADEAPVSWGLVLDRSGSMMGMMQDVYRAAIHVVDEGTEKDEMFATTFNKRVELASGFVTDQHGLEKSLLGLRADGTTALWDAMAYGLDYVKRGKHQKKVLVVITDGEDNASSIKLRELIDRAEEEEVLIYPVGMFESGGMGTSRSDYAKLELERIAEATGTRAHFPTSVKECREAMQEIAREVSQQYSVGYYPTNTARDGKWRKIRVVVDGPGGKTNYVARTRAGYYATERGGVK